MQNLIILNIKDYSGSLEKGFLLILFQLFLRWLCADYNYCKSKYTSHTKLDALAASLWALHIDAVTFYIPTQVHWESIPLSRGFSFSSMPLRIKWAGMSHTNHILKSISRPIKLQITGKALPSPNSESKLKILQYHPFDFWPVLVYMSKAGFYHQAALKKVIYTQKYFRFQKSQVTNAQKNADLLFNQNTYMQHFKTGAHCNILLVA